MQTDPDLFKKELPYIEKATWYRQHFDGCPHFMFFIGAAHTSAIQQTKYPFGQRIAYGIFSHDIGDWYHDYGELEKTASRIRISAHTRPHLARHIIRHFQPHEDAFYNACRLLKDLPFSRFSKEELTAHYRQFTEIYVRALAGSPLIDGFVLTTDTLLFSKLSSFLDRKKQSRHIHEYFSILTAPTFLSFLQKEQLAFLNMISTIRSNPSKKNNSVADTNEHIFGFEIIMSKTPFFQSDTLKKYICAIPMWMYKERKKNSYIPYGESQKKKSRTKKFRCAKRY